MELIKFEHLGTMLINEFDAGRLGYGKLELKFYIENNCIWFEEILLINNRKKLNVVNLLSKQDLNEFEKMAIKRLSMSGLNVELRPRHTDNVQTVPF